MSEKSVVSGVRAKKAVPAILLVAAILVAAVLAFLWTFCRVYVPEGHMAVVTAKTGRPLPPGQILAEKGEKGVLREVLGEGRHFLDPVTREWKIVPATTIPLGSVGLVTSKVGTDLPPGDILAPDELSKGVWRRVLGPGTYRLNPEGYDIAVLSAVSIPIGYVGIVTSLAGEPAPEGAFAGPGQKGVREQPLQPGLYYINPRAYQVDLVEVGMNQVSIMGRAGSVVLTKSQVSNASGALDELQQNALNRQQAIRDQWVQANAAQGFQNAADANRNLQVQAGVRTGAKPASKPMGSLAPAPKRQAARKNADRANFSARGGPMAAAERMVEPPDVDIEMAEEAPGFVTAGSVPPPSLPQSDAVAFGMDQFVQFPSIDGFSILIDMTVEFEILPSEISRVYMLYGDLPAVVGKIILPQILSVSRIKGSGYKAREFIDGEGRQKFQEEMTRELVSVLGEKHILVRNAIVRHVEVPEDILRPMQAASESKEQDLTNRTRQETAKKQALLNKEVALVAQSRREVEQETAKLVATIGAETRRDVATTNAATKVKVAEIGLERAKVEALSTKVKGEAAVQAEYLVANEEALGEQRRSAVFKDPATLADLAFADALPDELTVRVLHAGEGTLWTDLKGAALAVPAKE